MNHRAGGLLAAVMTAAVLAPASSRAQGKGVTLARDGTALAAIYAPAGVMAGDKKLPAAATFRNVSVSA